MLVEYILSFDWFDLGFVINVIVLLIMYWLGYRVGKRE